MKINDTKYHTEVFHSKLSLNYLILTLHITNEGAGIAQLVQQLATGWTSKGLEFES
jgi:hypothetical protein